MQGEGLDRHGRTILRTNSITGNCYKTRNDQSHNNPRDHSYAFMLIPLYAHECFLSATLTRQLQTSLYRSLNLLLASRPEQSMSGTGSVVRALLLAGCLLSRRRGPQRSTG